MSSLHLEPDTIVARITKQDIAVRLPWKKRYIARDLGGQYSDAWKCWLFALRPDSAELVLNAFRDLIDNPGSDAQQLVDYVEAHKKPLVRGQDSVVVPDGNIPGLKTQAWAHQRAAYAFCHPQEGAMLYMGMGTGKTLTTISLLHDSRRTLIITPKAVMAVWPKEFERHASYDIECLPLTFSSVKINAGKCIDFLKSADARRAPRACVIINYDSAWREPLASELLKYKWDTVVLDECHKIKSPGGKASGFCAKLRKKSAKKVYGLTGTPMPHSPLDLYGQFRAIDPTLFGTNFKAFSMRYSVSGDYGQPISYQNQAEMQERFFSRAFQAGRECIELPEATHTVIPVTLEPKAAKVYADLALKLHTEFESGEVTASNALTKLLRLQQVTGGTIKTDEGNLVIVSRAKQEALKELLDSMGSESCVVFCRFTPDIDAVRLACADLGIECLELSGYKNELARFQESTSRQVIAVQIQAGGVGVDLTRARYCVYMSPDFSLGNFEQSLARVHRPGQKHPVSYYHLIAQHTIDERIYRALQDKRDVVAEFMANPKEAFF